MENDLMLAHGAEVLDAISLAMWFSSVMDMACSLAMLMVIAGAAGWAGRAGSAAGADASCF